ncbi:MAG: hypothetical protein AB1758_03785 [Candidatus Eremiobacterota bacterium]
MNNIQFRGQQSATFPMTRDGRAGFTAPRTLEEGQKVLDQATLQGEVNSALDLTRATVQQLSRLNISDPKSMEGQTVAQGVPHDNRDLNPDPNVVLFPNAPIDFTTGKYFNNGQMRSAAELHLDPIEEDEPAWRRADPLGQVASLELIQGDGTHIKMSRQGEGQDQIVVEKPGQSSLTISRNHNLGTLTVLSDDPLGGLGPNWLSDSNSSLLGALPMTAGFSEARSLLTPGALGLEGIHSPMVGTSMPGSMMGSTPPASPSAASPHEAVHRQAGETGGESRAFDKWSKFLKENPA